MKRPIGILGSGNVGHVAAVHFVKIGYEVWLANSRGPDSLRDAIEQLGANSRAATVAQAVQAAEIVLLAVPWMARQATLEAAGGPVAFAGKIVIDAMNFSTEYPALDDLSACSSSEVVAMLLGSGARLVKAFNTIQAAILASGARLDLPPEGRLAIPLCGDDHEAKEVVSALIDAMGFAPVDIGTLTVSRLQEPHRSLYDKNFTTAEVRLELARYDHGQNSN